MIRPAARKKEGPPDDSQLNSASRASGRRACDYGRCNTPGGTGAVAIIANHVSPSILDVITPLELQSSFDDGTKARVIANLTCDSIGKVSFVSADCPTAVDAPRARPDEAVRPGVKLDWPGDQVKQPPEKNKEPQRDSSDGSARNRSPPSVPHNCTYCAFLFYFPFAAAEIKASPQLGPCAANGSRSFSRA